MTDHLFKILMNEVTVNHNGWYGTKRPLWTFVILSGTHVGRWDFVQGRVKWRMHQDLTPNISNPRPTHKTYKGWAAMVNKNAARVNDAVAWAQEFIPESRGLQPTQEYDWENSSIKVVLKETINYGRTGQLWDLQLMAGVVGREKVIEGLKVHPKRWEAILNFHAPTSFKERMKYCKAFAETWSHVKAMKKTYPGVHPANVKHIKMGNSLVNYALVGVDIVLTEAQVEEVISRANEMKRLFPKLRTKQFRSFIPAIAKIQGLTWGTPERRYVQDVCDCLRQANDTMALCKENEVPVPQHAAQVFQIMEKEVVSWSAIQDKHDAVALEYRTLFQQYQVKINEKQREAAREHHVKASEYVLFEGIKPLVTVEDFTKEGVEMHHCIAGYWSTTKAHLFAFELNGERASLELELSSKTVRQFYGPYNAQTSKPLKELLNKFLKANKCKTISVNDPLGWVNEAPAEPLPPVADLYLAAADPF
jgi:hypothetical protein